MGVARTTLEFSFSSIPQSHCWPCRRVKVISTARRAAHGHGKHWQLVFNLEVFVIPRPSHLVPCATTAATRALLRQARPFSRFSWPAVVMCRAQKKVPGSPGMKSSVQRSNGSIADAHLDASWSLASRQLTRVSNCFGHSAFTFRNLGRRRAEAPATDVVGVRTAAQRRTRTHIEPRARMPYHRHGWYQCPARVHPHANTATYSSLLHALNSMRDSRHVSGFSGAPPFHRKHVSSRNMRR